MEQYEGLKDSNDKTDAFWIADQLRLGILPTGNIYPKEGRPNRDRAKKNEGDFDSDTDSERGNILEQ